MLLKIAHPGAHMNIHLQALARVYEYCYCVTCSDSSIQCPTASLSMPTAVQQMWLKYLWIRRQGHSPPSGVAHRLLQQNLPSCWALCTTTDALPCILHVQGGALYTASSAEVHRRSFSHRSVKVVYRIVRSSARIHRWTGNAIWNLFLVTSRISMSMELPSPLYAPLRYQPTPSLTPLWLTC